MRTYKGKIDLELNSGTAYLEYEVEHSPIIPARLHGAPEDCYPEEGGIESVGFKIVIKSESIVDHIEILGDLSANYDNDGFEQMCIDDFEAEMQEWAARLTAMSSAMNCRTAFF